MSRWGKKQPVRQSHLEQARNNRASYSFYSSSRNVDTNTRARVNQSKKSRELKINTRHLPSVMLFAVLVLIVVFSTTLTTSPVVKFADGASPYRATNDYKKDITSIFSASMFNRSKLTISSEGIEKNILKQFPELDVVKVVLPIIGRRPAVTLHARTPVLLWQSKTRLLVVDGSGMAVSEAGSLPSSIRDKLVSIQDNSGSEFVSGDKVITSDAVIFIDAIKQQLLAKGLNIDKILLPNVANEIDIYIKDAKYYIKADYSGDARMQAGTFLAVKDKTGNGTQIKEYVDVRVEEKAFYR